MRQRFASAPLIAALLLFGGCGGSTTATTSTAPVSTTAASAWTLAPTPAAGDTTTTEPQPCDPAITAVAIGAPLEDTVTGSDQPGNDLGLFFCVEIPGGVSEATFAVTGMTANLDLYVGYPDLDTLLNGGLALWASTEDGTTDETISPSHPGGSEFIRAGSYYIEVAARDFHDSSPFTLTVTTP